MKRREFITLLGGAAAAWPLAARAQQSERMRRIGCPDEPAGGRSRSASSHRGVSRRACSKLGWTDRPQPAASTTAGARAIRSTSQTRGGTGRARAGRHSSLARRSRGAAATGDRTVPIVFATVVDPVGAGFVESLARPGGNVTGFTQFEYSMSGKWLELLKEIAPSVTRVAVLRDPDIGSAGSGSSAAIQAASAPSSAWS